MRASKLLSAAAATVLLLSTGSAFAKEELKSKNPWRDTEIGYEHAVNALAFDKAAEPTYAPYYAHRLSLAPYWHVSDYLYFRAKLELEQELTQTVNTDTKYRNEVVLSDLQLDAASKGITEPFTGIKLGGGLRFSFPTSKQSQAATMRFSIGPGINLSRKFPLLEGLTIGYGGRANFFNHKYTQPVPSSSSNRTCTDFDDSNCTNATSMDGVARNAWMSIAHGPTIAIELLPGLTFDLAYTFLYGFPYALSKAEVDVGTGKVEIPVKEDVQNVRFADWFTLSLGYTPLDYLGVALNVSTLAGALTPDSKYRTPFFSRATQVSLSLSLSIDPLIGKFL